MVWGVSMSDGIVSLAQTVFYVVSPLVTLLAVLVAYLALLKQSRPHLLVHYQPNPNIQSLIDLNIENLGNGMARDVAFSQPLPAQCYGIEKPDGEGSEVLSEGLPAIASGQKYVFDGGQYAGLSKKLGSSIEVQVSYKYRNPLGIIRSRNETCMLSVEHLKNMPTRTSAESAIVDALNGPNVTTLHRIERELHSICLTMIEISRKDDKENQNENA